MGRLVTPDGTEYRLPGISDPNAAMSALKTHPALGGKVPEGTRFFAEDSAPAMPPTPGATPTPEPFPVYDYPGDVATARVARPILETAGALGGGAVGSLLGPVGTIAGEAGGYALGSKAADLLSGDDTGSMGRKLAEGAAFSLVPRVAVAGLTKLGRGAVRSALKIPPTQAKEKIAAQAVDTVIEENLRVGKKGLEKARGIIESIEQQMDDVLRKSGSEIDTVKFVQAIDDIRPKFAYSSDPQGANAVLDEVANMAMNHPAVKGGKIPIAEAQKLKKGLYQELKGYYNNLQSLGPKQAIASNTESVGKAAWAESIRSNIMSDPTIPPEATSWLKREANIVNALRWIERRANVAANMDPITFNDVILGGLIREGVPYAVAVRMARSPAVLSQAGIYAAKSKAARAPMHYGGIATKGLLSLNNPEKVE